MIPKFKNEDAEREFWSKAKKTIFPNLKLTTESISLKI